MPISSTSSQNTILEANSAESEANRRIAAANQRVVQTEREANQTIDHLRQQHEQEYVALSSREEAALDSQRIKGYESLRDLKRAQQLDLRKNIHDSDTESKKLQEYYRNVIYNTGRRGDENLRELQAQEARKFEYENKLDQMQEDSQKNIHAERTNQLKNKEEVEFKRLGETLKEDLEKKKLEAEEAREKAGSKLQSQFEKTTAFENEVIGKIENQATHQIKEIRQDTAEKLAAYSSRQRDPFYKLVTTHAKLTEHNNSYVLTAQIPQHEQAHIAAAVKGENLVLTGYRRNEESLEISPGHTQGTASYQSYHESFPLEWPVDAKKMTREFDGDTVIIRVPKKGEYAFKTPKQAPPAKARVEPPKFPINLPHTEHKENEEPQSISKDQGSGTLA
jgi:HSP20 family molecular chaperone IbpA